MTRNAQSAPSTEGAAGDEVTMDKSNPRPIGRSRELLRQLRHLGDVSAPATILPVVLERVGLVESYARLETPIGPVFMAYNDHGVSALMRAPSAAPSGPAAHHGHAHATPTIGPCKALAAPTRPAASVRVRARRLAQGATDSPGRGAPIRLGGARDRFSKGCTRGGFGPQAQSYPAPDSLPSGGTKRRERWGIRLRQRGEACRAGG
jgi:hypothetical protein